jgi:hypothetical protein
MDAGRRTARSRYSFGKLENLAYPLAVQGDCYVQGTKR